MRLSRDHCAHEGFWQGSHCYRHLMLSRSRLAHLLSVVSEDLAQGWPMADGGCVGLNVTLHSNSEMRTAPTMRLGLLTQPLTGWVNGTSGRPGRRSNITVQDQS